MKGFMVDTQTRKDLLAANPDLNPALPGTTERQVIFWEVLKLKQDERTFIIRGGGFVLHGYVWRGAMKADVFWGLKALENPVLAVRLLHRWHVKVPRYFAAQDNMGLNRHFVEFRPLASGTSFVLRFQEYVPTELLSSLKAAFGGATAKEPDDEEHAGAAIEHPPEAALGRGEGRPEPRQGRKPAGRRQDPRAKRQIARKAKKGR